MNQPISDEQIKTLINSGYCNIGSGKIARRGTRDVTRDLIDTIPLHGFDRRSLDRLDDLRREHLYRCYCAKSTYIGTDDAELFPDSAKTLTHYVRLETGEATENRALLYNWSCNANGIHDFKVEQDALKSKADIANAIMKDDAQAERDRVTEAYLGEALF